MKKYLGFEDIPVYNFYKLAETSDMRWFYKKFRTDKSIVINEAETSELLELYKEIYNDRVKYTNDIKTAEYYRKLNEVSSLETKLYRLTTAFNALLDIPFENNLFKDYVTYFKEDEGYSYQNEITSKEERLKYISWLQRKVKAFKTKVNVKKANYADVLKPIEVTNENAKFDVIKEKLLLQESLGGISIDVYKCPLIEWCAMIMRAEQKSEDAKKQIDKLKQKR